MMLRLHNYILILVLWLLFLFNVEELGISGILTITFSVSVLLVILIALALLLPRIVRLSLVSVNGIAVVAFIAVGVAQQPSLFAEHAPVVSLFSLVAILISVSLAHMVGSLSVDAVDTMRDLIFSDTPNMANTSKESQAHIDYLMQQARRENKPFSVIACTPHTQEDAQIIRRVTAREIVELLARRYHLAALGRLLAWRVRRTDFVIDRSDDGWLLLVTQKAEKGQAADIIDRLGRQAQERLGIDLRWGIASFPDEGVTFEEVVDRAIADVDAGTYRTPHRSVSVHSDDGNGTSKSEQVAAYK